MFTKPCANPSCGELCQARTPGLIAKAKYHSLSCFYDYKRRMGWSVTPTYTLPQRQASGRKGGLAGAGTRRRRAVRSHVLRIQQLAPDALMAKLTQREQTLITLLLVRAFERGRESGVFYERVRQSRVDQSRKREAAA
jgi:hypothetical protein